MGPYRSHGLSDFARCDHPATGYRWTMAWLVFVGTVYPGSLSSAAETAERAGRAPISGRRVVKHFNFDEEPFNNFGTLPMFWRPHGGRGFPRFLEGSFDKKAGHASPPSFQLSLDGGSLAYHYEGRDIRVGADSDYLVVAWVRTDSLDTARAYISAYFLDRKGKPISGTERRSQLVGGTDTRTDWEPIPIGLQGNVPGAWYIGLSIWLTQERVWNTRPRPIRHVEREDVKAHAWFDDITVYRLPLVSLYSASPGNVFDEHDRVELRAMVSDPDGLHLEASLTIRSEDGQFTDVRDVHIQTHDTGQGERITYTDLPIGLFRAKLTVSTGDTPLVWRTLRFTHLAERFSSPTTTGRGFGVVMSEIDPALLPGQRALLEQLWAEYVKLPVWFAQRAVTRQMAAMGDTIDRYLEAIVETHADPIGILRDDPPDQNPGAKAVIRSMLDLFGEDPLAWKPLIAGTWSRYAGLIHVWQIGNDGEEAVFLDQRLGQIIPVLHREMKPLMGEPLLATTSSAGFAANPTDHADYDAVLLSAIVRTDDIARYIQPLLGEKPQNRWITVEALPQKTYAREVRLADLGRRLAEAAFQNVGGVFLAAPWESEADEFRCQVNPTEDYIILRTVADVLGGATPVSRTTIDGQAQCLVFDCNGQAILFVWDDYAPAEGREHVLYLGEQAEQIDLWGRRKPLDTVGSRQRVRISATPTFIVNTPTWLIEWRRQFVLAPSLLEASFEKSERELVFRNTFREPVTGVVRLCVPESWEVRPRKLSFALQPGEIFRRTIDIRFPINAEASVRPVVGHFTLDADRRYQILAPAWFELGLDNIDIDTFVWRKGDRVVVRQSMTNRTTTPINFEGYILPPHRQRITRLFVNFQPGQSMTKDYVLDNATDLVGQKVRVGLREIEGSRVWNRILSIH